MNRPFPAFSGNLNMPGNVALLVDPSVIALLPKKEGQFSYGVKPCVGQTQSNGSIRLLDAAIAYGCTEPFVLVRQPFERRSAQFRYDEFRRPSYWDLSLSFAKTTRITDKVRMQVHVEAFDVFNSPMYDERQYHRSTSAADFGRINRKLDRPVELPALRAAGIAA